MTLLDMPCLDLCVLCVYFHAIWSDPCLHMLICLDSCSSMSLCYVSTCLRVCFYAYMSRSMFSHAYVLGSMFSKCFMISFMCLYAPYHVCVCLSCHVLLQPFCRFVFLSCVLTYWFKPDLDPLVFVTVHTPWPTSKGLDHPCLHVYACLLLCFMLLIASLVLGFARLDAHSGFVVVWLHSDAYEVLFGCNYLGCITMMPVASCTPFLLSAPCNDMLSMLVYATRWLCMHLYMLTHISMHESCLLMCRPCFNTMNLWTSNPNLHLSLAKTTLCLLSCLFAVLLVCLLSCFFACHSYHAYPFYDFSYALCIFSSHCLSASFFSLPLHVQTWSEDAWS